MQPFLIANGQVSLIVHFLFCPTPPKKSMVNLTMSIWKINVEYVSQNRMDIPQYHFVG